MVPQKHASEKVKIRRLANIVPQKFIARRPHEIKEAHYHHYIEYKFL
jgi:hypothetical protein